MCACPNLLSVQVEHSHVALLSKTSQALLPNTDIRIPLAVLHTKSLLILDWRVRAPIKSFNSRVGMSDPGECGGRQSSTLRI